MYYVLNIIIPPSYLIISQVTYIATVAFHLASSYLDLALALDLAIYQGPVNILSVKCELVNA